MNRLFSIQQTTRPHRIEVDQIDGFVIDVSAEDVEVVAVVERVRSLCGNCFKSLPERRRGCTPLARLDRVCIQFIRAIREVRGHFQNTT